MLPYLANQLRKKSVMTKVELPGSPYIQCHLCSSRLVIDYYAICDSLISFERFLLTVTRKLTPAKGSVRTWAFAYLGWKIDIGGGYILRLTYPLVGSSVNRLTKLAITSVMNDFSLHKIKNQYIKYMPLYS